MRGIRMHWLCFNANSPAIWKLQGFPTPVWATMKQWAIALERPRTYIPPALTS